MNKKIIALAIMILALVVLFAACKKDEYIKIDGVEASTDTSGNIYVTNIDGDVFPVTTDEDGFYNDIREYATMTTASSNGEKNTSKPVDSSSGTTDAEKTSQPNTTNPTTSKSDSPTTQVNSTDKNNSEPTTGKKIEIIGDGNNSKKPTEDSISWDEIVGKKNS